MAFEVETEHYEDDSASVDSIVSSFELLQVSIKDATNIKNIMTSRLNRAISLKKEVELKEKAAEEAKEAAATSHLDILAKVEELKQLQQQAKRTNDMHAREVYAQRVVLAKDLSELQLRVSGVSNQGRQSLTVSDEMHMVLKRRLNKAYKDKDLEDKKRLEKETLANEALAFEESKMLKLVEESNRLKQETVKNSEDIFRYRESVVDILHGDVSHKYQDTHLLIECLDQPAQHLSGLLSYSKTSPDLDLGEQKVNMNGSSFEVKSAPVAVVVDITEVGPSVSTKGRVASARTYVEWEEAPAGVKYAAKRAKGKTIEECHTLRDVI